MRSRTAAMFVLMVLAFLSLDNALSAQPSPERSKLIEQGAKGELHVDAKDRQGRPILITAILYGTTDQVQALVDQGFPPNSTYQKLPAITYTVSDTCYPEKLEILIDNGADINTAEPISGSYPIHSAVQHNDLSCLDVLLEHGAKPDVQDGLGQTPYFQALDFSNKKAMHRLWTAGANPAIKAANGLDVFHYSIIVGKTDLVKGLLTDYHDANFQR